MLQEYEFLQVIKNKIQKIYDCFSKNKEYF